MRFHPFVSFFAIVSLPALVPGSIYAQPQAADAAQQPAAASVPAAAPVPLPQGEAAPLPNAKPSKVWTNDEIDTLRNKHSVSVVGNHAPQKVSATTKGYSQEKDPAWYRKQLQPLQAEIEKYDGQIAKLNAFLSGDHVSDPPDPHHMRGLTPQEQLKQLEGKRAKDIEKVNDLMDRARHNDIPPGALR
jgi:hypothetical protein